MKKYLIEIKETMTHVTEMDANSEAEARQKVSDMYDDAQIILTAENANIEVEFATVEGKEQSDIGDDTFCEIPGCEKLASSVKDEEFVCAEHE